jgi:hypothetical protein
VSVMADRSPSREAMNLPPAEGARPSAPEVVPGDDSDADPPTDQDDPAYVARVSDPSFRTEMYGHRITPEEQERRQRINVSIFSILSFQNKNKREK